ncbi:MAG: branched-chain amino acid aminotransferase [Rhodospirillales bacterium]
MQAWHFFDGDWHQGNPPIMGPMSHGFWMASTVFDGARSFEGVAPDLDRHCQRVVASAETFGLKSPYSPEEIQEIGEAGRKKFPKDVALYLRPAMWAETGFVAADPESTRFCFTLHESPMPPGDGMAVTKSPYIRPLANSAPVEAKASCLYPNSGRALSYARGKGFDNAVVLDALGNVAELATANLWMVKDGQAITPAPNGCFLNGITRQRVAKLLAESGIAVIERRVTYDDLLTADEIFASGNYGKVQPITRIEERSLQPGPVTKQAREAYWDWALSG